MVHKKFFSGMANVFSVDGFYVIFYQNKPNLHNHQKSGQRKVFQKNLEDMINNLWS